ncbi:hypothetical protein JDV02_001232 [Purpureocillium takamizusanense]|uniref:Uncharacterized protein n=1 Tax=Purpureocillium takamizusanense TaxID=2060973 RepID=A0A9Q8Q8T8_9HYPO|nr:uncharacterized protein JDV02_001232 [Purpureocillium takamizusanense]UNI14623.1 hypothetical protein JDV02_001232 [Purpureocillium takamizusanense]
MSAQRHSIARPLSFAGRTIGHEDICRVPDDVARITVPSRQKMTFLQDINGYNTASTLDWFALPYLWGNMLLGLRKRLTNPLSLWSEPTSIRTSRWKPEAFENQRLSAKIVMPKHIQASHQQ